MGKLDILRELLLFLWVQGKWWLTPLVILMVLLGFMLVAAQGSALSPFIYALF